MLSRLKNRIHVLVNLMRQRIQQLEKFVISCVRSRRRSGERIEDLIRNRVAGYWHKAAEHRYLIGANPRHLSPKLRLQRLALKFFLELPDRRYRKSFTRFGEAITTPSGNERELSSRSGIMLMIGTLGPGGAERQAVLTLTGSAQRGVWPLRIACVFLEQEWQRFFVPHLENVGIPVRELERDNSLDPTLDDELLLRTAQTSPQRLDDVKDYLRTLLIHKPAIAHFWLDECNIKGGMAAVAAGVPRIVLGLRSVPPDNFAVHQPYMREGYRWLVKQQGVVLLNNSKAGARAYEKWIKLPADTIQVVHNGFDFDDETLNRYRAGRATYRQQHGIPQDVLVVGTVIRLSEEKRPLLWLEIAAAVCLRLPNVRFLLVGDGLMRAEVDARAARDDLRGSVSVIGYEKQALAAIAAMDIFLLTSRAEGLPNVLVEAQALGVPAVTTNVGGAPETICHGVTGWVLEKDQVAYAAEHLIRLLQDTEWRRQAAQEAPQFVRTAFGVERMLDKTLAVYGSAVQNTNLSP